MGDSKPGRGALSLDATPCGSPEASRAGITVEILCRCDLWQEMLADGCLAERAVRAAIGAAATRRRSSLQLSILLTCDEEIRDLNRDWRGRNEPTNVLSFPLRARGIDGEEGCPLGDIVLAAETVRREATEAGRTVDQHAAHLIVHGVLHLLGFEHESEGEAQRMETLEVRILETLGVPDPYGVAADAPLAR